MPMELLSGKTAVITGGGQGLGFAIAEVFAENGANIVIGDIDAMSAAEAAQRLNVGNRATGIRCDVTDSDDMDALVNVAVTRYGQLDVMVNNAGITRDATMRKMPIASFDLVLEVHLKGTWLGTRAAAAIMREHGGGSIINMSSISGKVGMAGQTNYSAAKAGIVGLTKAAAKEVGFANVRVNALQPGIIETPMTQQLRPDIRAAKLAEVPLGRFGQSTEVAHAALFLASDLSSYVTGITLEIAGGRHI